MSGFLLILAKAAFAVAGCGAGLRLAQLARGDGGDRVLGLVSLLIFIGGAGLLAFGLGPVVAVAYPEMARGMMIAGDAGERLALLLLAGFVWHTFGRERGLRLAVALAIAAALVVDGYWILRAQRWPDSELPAALEATSQVVFSLALVWSTIESWLQYRRALRQRALGLIEPETANRFLLWCLATGSLSLVCLTTAFAALVVDAPGWPVAANLVRAFLYWTVAGTIALGFFPPEPYLRWLRDRADAGARP